MIETRNDLERPLTARSVIASTLLGANPPWLPSSVLVRSGQLFGITEGTTRTALSRMVAAGDIEAQDGGYRLVGALLDRQTRQEESRAARTRSWDGTWTAAAVTEERRSAEARSALRAAMRSLRLAELREGYWLRPDNLDPDRLPDAAAVVTAQCARFSVRPESPPATDLAARLWDLGAWAERADDLRRRMASLFDRLEAGDTEALAPAFVLSAAVLRHTQADPLLPRELVPEAWPGAALRSEYDAYDAAFLDLWRSYVR